MRRRGRVVGYANLHAPARQFDGRLARHDRRRAGVARPRRRDGALKRATIAWAATNGLEALETANDIDNAPMRAVNRRLGYQPLPDEIYFRGPVRARRRACTA